MPKVIKVENLSKVYQLGEIGTGTITRDLERFWARVRGKEDPFLKIGELNDRTKKGQSDVVWSLKDIDFAIEQGDAVGIIGRNGAGKSTLLKILSQVTSPTTGKVKIKGRVASLLEVGTGFHPELSGRENIYLNGAILGMRKSEIRRKFDEIVDFSGVERYVDTPVKRYSSGMYVRLAFAVAAHLESDIMIVDEVLAVGDAEFQKKCLGKMDNVSKNEGRTILFVSHNMGAVKNLCSNGIILDQGMITLSSDVNECVKAYTQIQTSSKTAVYLSSEKNNAFREVSLETDGGLMKSDFGFDENINIRMLFKIEQKYLNSSIGIKVLDNMERCIFTSEKNLKALIGKACESAVLITIPSGLLTPGQYKITFGLHIPNIQVIEVVNDRIFFEIMETGTGFYQLNGADLGCVIVDCAWRVV